jgi:hypothetical protein
VIVPCGHDPGAGHDAVAGRVLEGSGLGALAIAIEQLPVGHDDGLIELAEPSRMTPKTFPCTPVQEVKTISAFGLRQYPLHEPSPPARSSSRWMTSLCR